MLLDKNDEKLLKKNSKIICDIFKDEKKYEIIDSWEIPVEIIESLNKEEE